MRSQILNELCIGVHLEVISYADSPEENRLQRILEVETYRKPGLLTGITAPMVLAFVWISVRSIKNRLKH